MRRDGAALQPKARENSSSIMVGAFAQIFRTNRKWNALPAHVFPPSYNLGSFKRGVKKQHAGRQGEDGCRALLTGSSSGRHVSVDSCATDALTMCRLVARCFAEREQLFTLKCAADLRRSVYSKGKKARSCALNFILPHQPFHGVLISSNMPREFESCCSVCTSHGPDRRTAFRLPPALTTVDYQILAARHSCQKLRSTVDSRLDWESLEKQPVILKFEKVAAINLLKNNTKKLLKYNFANKIINIYSDTKVESRRKIIAWLLNLNYDEAENILI
ncbi:hypothetical protein evm_005213 [Chilo suppressalis]|nr:hypothetical protein evm_005213 [Chilo suppressalis]